MGRILKLDPKDTNHCFGCGAANDAGMKLVFELDFDDRRTRGHHREHERRATPPSQPADGTAPERDGEDRREAEHDPEGAHDGTAHPLVDEERHDEGDVGDVAEAEEEVAHQAGDEAARRPPGASTRPSCSSRPA